MKVKAKLHSAKYINFDTGTSVKEEHYGRPFLVDPEPEFVNV